MSVFLKLLQWQVSVSEWVYFVNTTTKEYGGSVVDGLE